MLSFRWLLYWKDYQITLNFHIRLGMNKNVKTACSTFQLSIFFFDITEKIQKAYFFECMQTRSFFRWSLTARKYSLLLDILRSAGNLEFLKQYHDFCEVKSLHEKSLVPCIFVGDSLVWIIETTFSKTFNYFWYLIYR